MKDSREAATTKNKERAADDVGVPEAEPRTAAPRLPTSTLDSKLELPHRGYILHQARQRRG